MAMGDHGGGSGWTRPRLLVEIVLEHRCAPLVRTRPYADGATAGGFEAFIAVTFAEPPDAQTRAEALLGMGP
jgi:hypothetical protein